MPNHPHYPNDLVAQRRGPRSSSSKAGALVQVDLDPDAYDQGHLPGADRRGTGRPSSATRRPKRDPHARKSSRTSSDRPASRPKTPVILYGDNNNWFACWAFWLMRMHGHDGRPPPRRRPAATWMQAGLPLSLDRPDTGPPSPYIAAERRPLEGKASHRGRLRCLLQPRNPRPRRRPLRPPSTRAASPAPASAPPPSAPSPATSPPPSTCHGTRNCNPDGTFKAPD